MFDAFYHKVFALVTRILSQPDPGTRMNLVQKTRDDLSALDYSGVANNPRLACFLAELFYILGEDVTSPDKQGNTLLHMVAARGDQCGPTMEVLSYLLSLDSSKLS